MVRTIEVQTPMGEVVAVPREYAMMKAAMSLLTEEDIAAALDPKQYQLEDGGRTAYLAMAKALSATVKEKLAAQEEAAQENLGALATLPFSEAESADARVSQQEALEQTQRDPQSYPTPAQHPHPHLSHHK